MTAAAALALGWFGTDIARLLFGYGNMPAEGVATIGSLLAIGVFSLPAYTIGAAFQSIMYASQDTRSPFFVMLFTKAVYVPLIVLHPRLGHGRRVPGLAQSIDIAPTLYELAAVPPPARLSGRLSFNAYQESWKTWQNRCFNLNSPVCCYSPCLP